MIALFVYGALAIGCFLTGMLTDLDWLWVPGYIFLGLQGLTLVWMIRRDIKLGHAPWQRKPPPRDPRDPGQRTTWGPGA